MVQVSQVILCLLEDHLALVVLACHLAHQLLQYPLDLQGLVSQVLLVAQAFHRDLVDHSFL